MNSRPPTGLSDPAAEERRQVRRLRLASVVEGTTLVVLLLVAVPAKHLFGLPILVRLVGPLHGLAFLAYLWMLAATVSGGGWSRRETLRLALAAFVPFGAFANTGLLRRREAAL